MEKFLTFQPTTMSNKSGNWLVASLVVLFLTAGVLTTILLVRFKPAGATNPHDTYTPQMTRRGMVFLGDSLAQGVGATHSSNTLAAHVYTAVGENQGLWNLASAGATIKQVQDDQLPRLKSITAKRLYLLVGANDVTMGTDSVTFATTYQAVVATLASEHLPLVLLNIPKLAATPAVPEERKSEADLRTQAFNKEIADVAKANGAQLIDVYSFSAEQLTPQSGFLADDQFHPNDKGYEKLSALVLR